MNINKKTGTQAVYFSSLLFFISLVWYPVVYFFADAAKPYGTSAPSMVPLEQFFMSWYIIVPPIILLIAIISIFLFKNNLDKSLLFKMVLFTLSFVFLAPVLLIVLVNVVLILGALLGGGPFGSG